MDATEVQRFGICVLTCRYGIYSHTFYIFDLLGDPKIRTYVSSLVSIVFNCAVEGRGLMGAVRICRPHDTRLSKEAC